MVVQWPDMIDAFECWTCSEPKSNVMGFVMKVGSLRCDLLSSGTGSQEQNEWADANAAVSGDAAAWYGATCPADPDQ